jgi:hypothetical protein
MTQLHPRTVAHYRASTVGRAGREATAPRVLGHGGSGGGSLSTHYGRVEGKGPSGRGVARIPAAWTVGSIPTRPYEPLCHAASTEAPPRTRWRSEAPARRTSTPGGPLRQVARDGRATAAAQPPAPPEPHQPAPGCIHHEPRGSTARRPPPPARAPAHTNSGRIHPYLARHRPHSSHLQVQVRPASKAAAVPTFASPRPPKQRPYPLLPAPYPLLPAPYPLLPAPCHPSGGQTAAEGRCLAKAAIWPIAPAR